MHLIWLFLTLAGTSLVLDGCAATNGPTPVPTELVSLWESSEPTDVSTAWPPGLRFVLYDDGEVLLSTKAASQSEEETVVAGRLSPNEAKQMAAKLIAALAEVTPTLDAGVKGNSPRTTILHVWDEASGDYRMWWALGHPCPTLAGLREAPLDMQMRALLDRRFLDACAALTAMKPRELHGMQPTGLRMQLARGDRTEGEFLPWAENWQAEASQGREIAVCIGKSRDAITRQMQSQDPRNRQVLVGKLVRMADGTMGTVTGFTYSLPGPIAYVFGRGSDNVTTWLIASGPCHPRPTPATSGSRFARLSSRLQGMARHVVPGRRRVSLARPIEPIPSFSSVSGARQQAERRRIRSQRQRAQPLQPLAAVAFLDGLLQPCLRLAAAAFGEARVVAEPVCMLGDFAHEFVEALAGRRGHDPGPAPTNRGLPPREAERADHVAFRAGRGAPHVALGDDDDVGDLDDAGLHELQTVAGAGLHAEDDGVRRHGDVGLRLPNAHGLDQHHVVERTHQYHGAVGDLRQAAELIARRHGADEDALVMERMKTPWSSGLVRKRVRSPNSAPPDRRDEGSMAMKPTLLPFAR